MIYQNEKYCTCQDRTWQDELYEFEMDGDVAYAVCAKCGEKICEFQDW